jgi:hypothetical protein
MKLISSFIVGFCLFGLAVSKAPNFDYDFTGFKYAAGFFAKSCTNIKQQV